MLWLIVFAGVLRAAYGSGCACTRHAVELIFGKPYPADCLHHGWEDLVIGCTARKAGVISVHCGHFVIDGQHYERVRGSAENEAFKMESQCKNIPLPYPGNPFFVHQWRFEDHCTAPASKGDLACSINTNK